MKKIIMALIVAPFFLSSISYAYAITIKNSTDAIINAFVEYGGGGLCSPDPVKLDPGAEKSIDAKGCCAWLATFTAKSTNLLGKVVRFEPPFTGANVACKSWSAEILRSGDNDFIVEKR